ncbi:MAG: hypothetical protein AAGA54_14310 [Myxococcota bacterium]
MTPTLDAVLPDIVLASRVLEVESEREVTEMFRPCADVIVLRILGHFSLRAATQVTTALEKEVDGQAFHMFAEWTAVTGYDAAARKHVTEWVIAHRGLVRRSWFCAGNRMVEMGISVGAMAVSLVGVDASVVPYAEWLNELLGHVPDAGGARVG